jgi:hypothetical protein
MATGRYSRRKGAWIGEKRPWYMGGILLESSSCMGGIVSAQALRNKKARKMQDILKVMGRANRVIVSIGDWVKNPRL